MLFTEYDEEKTLKAIGEEMREEGLEQGRAEGRAEVRASILREMLAQNCPETLILSLGFTREEIEASK